MIVSGNTTPPIDDTRRFDVCVVGAGLVGLAVARALVESLTGISVLLIDKEDRVAAHQSGHNSGVVHSGLYYAPGSLKARLCLAGSELIHQYCADNGLPIRRSGKLVIATDPAQLTALDVLHRRGIANGLVGIERLDPDGIRHHEPHATGIAALHVPQAGVTDYPAIAVQLAADLRAVGASIALGSPVTTITHDAGGVAVATGDTTYSARVLVNCAGLHSDRIALLAGLDPSVRIVAFRGEYYRLAASAEHLVNALVYPIPDPRFPFLGVHFTRRIDGTVEVGPNAVLALGRENYRGAPRSWSDVAEMMRHRGFWRLAMRHWRPGLAEMINSRSQRRYANLARALVPEIDVDDLVPGDSGVRAQAVARDGSLADDFVIERHGSTLHVLNAPSPAATASLAIGRHIAAEVVTLLRP